MINALFLLEINPALIQKAADDFETAMKLSGYTDSEITRLSGRVVLKIAEDKKLGNAITSHIVDTYYRAANAALNQKFKDIKITWEMSDEECNLLINGKPYQEFFIKK